MTNLNRKKEILFFEPLFFLKHRFGLNSLTVILSHFYNNVYWCTIYLIKHIFWGEKFSVFWLHDDSCVMGVQSEHNKC